MESQYKLMQAMNGSAKNAVSAIGTQSHEGVDINVYKKDSGSSPYFYKINGRWFSNVQSDKFFSSESDAYSDAKKRIDARSKMK